MRFIGTSLALVCCLSAIAQPNLIANPGFELGSLAMWQATPSPTATAAVTQTTGVVVPFAGGWMAFLGPVESPRNSISQTVEIPDGATSLRFTARYQTEDGDQDGIGEQAWFRFTCFDALGDAGPEFLYGPYESPNLQWSGFVQDISIPAECAMLSCSLEGVLMDGSVVNVFFDDIELVVISCVADTNTDGVLSPADFNAWILAFNDQTPACDQNGDGLCTPSDFNAWILNYNAGC